MKLARRCNSANNSPAAATAEMPRAQTESGQSERRARSSVREQTLSGAAADASDADAAAAGQTGASEFGLRITMLYL